MTVTPYRVHAVDEGSGKFSATLSYGDQIVASEHDLKEKDVQKWASAAAQAHKESIAPAAHSTKQTVIKSQFVA